MGSAQLPTVCADDTLLLPLELRGSSSFEWAHPPGFATAPPLFEAPYRNLRIHSHDHSGLPPLRSANQVSQGRPHGQQFFHVYVGAAVEGVFADQPEMLTRDQLFPDRVSAFLAIEMV
eukprot:6467640-Amphidinium_carterae.1